jgi:hypothetical protein
VRISGYNPCAGVSVTAASTLPRGRGGKLRPLTSRSNLGALRPECQQYVQTVPGPNGPITVYSAGMPQDCFYIPILPDNFVLDQIMPWLIGGGILLFILLGGL